MAVLLRPSPPLVPLVLLQDGGCAPDGISDRLLAFALASARARVGVLDVGALPVDEADALRRSWGFDGAWRAWRGIARPCLLRALAVLDRAGASGRQMQSLYGIEAASDVSRLRALLRAAPDLRRGYETGALSLAHVARLVALPVEAQCELAALTRTRGMSVRQLEARRRSALGAGIGAIAASSGSASEVQGGAEIRAYAASLSEALGARVALHASLAAAGAWDFEVEFFDVEALAGVLERIGRGVQPGAGGGGARQRAFRIQALTTQELDGLLGHLAAEQ